MRPTNTQLRHIEELSGRVLTREGADRLIRALLYLDGERFIREDRAINADPELVAVLEPYSERDQRRRLFPEPIPIGEMILAWREDTGTNQDALGDLIGVTGTSIHYWESKATTPRRKLLPVIAQTIGVDVPTLEEARLCQIKQTREVAA